jgi:hypothetical protein
MNEIQWETEWEDDDFGQEFIKFRESNQFNCVSHSPNTTVLFIRPDYSSILPYENQWRKKRKKIRVQEIRIMAGTPNIEDQIISDGDVWLDMGARLYKAVKEAFKNKWDCIQLVKRSNPMDKFDVWYAVNEYKIQKQKTIPKKTSAK